MKKKILSNLYQQELIDKYPESVTLVDQKVAHTYKFMFKYEMFFLFGNYEEPFFYFSLFFLSNGIYFSLLLAHGILKYILIVLVLLYIYLVFKYIEHCIIQFMEEIKAQYILTTFLRASIYMYASVLLYTYAANSFFDIEDYIFVVLAIIEISYLYYRKKDITKGYYNFSVSQFQIQKKYDLKCGSKIFPELKIKKKRFIKFLLSIPYLVVPFIFLCVMVFLVSLNG